MLEQQTKRKSLQGEEKEDEASDGEKQRFKQVLRLSTGGGGGGGGGGSGSPTGGAGESGAGRQFYLLRVHADDTSEGEGGAPGGAGVEVISGYQWFILLDGN